MLGIVVLLGVIAWALWYFLDGRWYEGTDDAYISGNVVQITPQMPGTVISIGADDGDLVHAGDVLVQLDPSDADVALAEAKANLANTVRKVRGLYSSVSGAQADVAARKTAVDKARADYNRRVALAKSGAISAEELAHASDALTSRRERPDRRAAAVPDQQGAGRRYRGRLASGRAGRRRPGCAPPISTMRAPPWSRRWTAMWPNARCRSASACSPAPR